MEDAFSLLVPYAKNCRAWPISLFTGMGERVIFELLNERKVDELIFSSDGQTEEERMRFFEAHRDSMPSPRPDGTPVQSKETEGLPHEIVDAAKNAVRRHAGVPSE